MTTTLSASSPAPRLPRSSVVLTFGEATRGFMGTTLSCLPAHQLPSSTRA
jgi:hypothetical protein